MILTNLFRLSAATPENPRFNLNDPNAWDEFQSGGPSSTGLRINRETALTFAPWWRGITLLANTVAKMPLYVYRTGGESVRTRDRAHPAYPLLRWRPNPYQTAFDFVRQLTGHAASGGNGYAYVSRRGDGRPLPVADGGGLFPMDPDSTYPVRADGVLWYVTAVKNGEPRRLRAEDVLHVKGFGHDGLSGIGVFDKARESLGLGLAARKHQAIFFKNGGRPGVVLETPNRLLKEARDALREGWERMHSGLDNAHRTAVLDAGLKANKLSFSAEDAQLMETRQFQVREIALWIGVPPHKLGDFGKQGYGTLEQENASFLDESIDPWAINWEGECRAKLLTEQEQAEESHEVEFQRAGLQRADTMTRAAYYRVALGGRPWMTQNEVRQAEHLNPDDDAKADTILEPLNMGSPGGDQPPADGPAKPPPKDAPPADRPPKKKRLPQEDAAARAVLEAAAGRMVRRLGHAARAAAKKPAEFGAFVDGLDADHGQVVREAMGPASLLLASQDADPADLAAYLIAAARRWLLDASECRPAELAAKVDQHMASGERLFPPLFAGHFLSEEPQ